MPQFVIVNLSGVYRSSAGALSGNRAGSRIEKPRLNSIIHIVNRTFACRE